MVSTPRGKFCMHAANHVPTPVCHFIAKHHKADYAGHQHNCQQHQCVPLPGRSGCLRGIALNHVVELLQALGTPAFHIEVYVLVLVRWVNHAPLSHDTDACKETIRQPCNKR